MSTKLNVVIAAVAVVALVIGMKLWHHTPQSTTPGGLNAFVISPPKEIARFSLLETTGKPFKNSSLWANWTFILFGSATHATPELTETMNALNKMTQMIQTTKQTPVPQIAFISTDLANDSLEKINKFSTSFNPNFIGVTGDPKQIASLSQEVPAKHPTVILLIDPSGKLAALFPEPHHPESMMKDFQIIVQNEG